MFGQSLLLARRLIGAGVPIVQANMGHMNNWDTHAENCNPAQDEASAAARPRRSRPCSTISRRVGCSTKPCVIMVGEFGRTPRIGQDSQGLPQHKTGRDHWAGVFSRLVRRRRSRRAARSSAGPTRWAPTPPRRLLFLPSDLGATIYQALGVDHESLVNDQLAALRFNSTAGR